MQSRQARGPIAQLVTPIAIGADSELKAMRYCVYIIFSEKLNKYYIGQTSLKVEERVKEHNSSFNGNSFTTRGIPWALFHVIECKSREQAIKIEAHIKRMKSTKFIYNLKKYPELCQKLLDRYY